MDREGQGGYVGPTLSLYIYIYDREEQILAVAKQRDERERVLFYFFIFFSYLFYTRSFDRRNSSGQERKFIYSTRATREYQKHGISPRIQVRS